MSKDRAFRERGAAAGAACPVSMTKLDCRGKPDAEAGRAIIGHFNALAPGSRMTVALDAFNPGLRVWLLEAGARHAAAREDGGSWQLTIARGAAPAQGSIPGVHHIAGHGRNLWVCERDRRVARIDGDTREVSAIAAVARKASHLAVDADARRVFVADAEAEEVIALEANGLAEIGRWSAPGTPQLPLVSPDGIVCVTGPRTGVLTLAHPQGRGYRARTFAIGDCPHDPAVSRDGAHLWVPCAGEGRVVKVRLADGVVEGKVAVGDGPSHLALHPMGDRVYSANSFDGTVTCFSVSGEVLASAASGGWAHAIEITPDGRQVVAANFLDDTLTVFDAITLERVIQLETEAYPHGLDISPDGRYAVATGFAASALRVYDPARWREVARIEVGGGSSHTAFCGGTAFVACSVADHVACIDLPRATCAAQIRLEPATRH